MWKKRAAALLSLCLTLAIVLSSLCLTASAAGASHPTVTLVVPEAIYLKPEVESYTQSGSYSFQWYVNNSQYGATLSGTSLKGSVYFNCAGVTQATLSYKYYNESLTSSEVLYGGSITAEGAVRAQGSAFSITPGTTPMYITGGTTPTLSASQTGCYIVWTVTFTDPADQKVKTVQAYTYVYKPYVQPVGVAQRMRNDRGNNTYGADIAWISGVHGIASTDGTRYPRTSAGQYSLVPFSSVYQSGELIGDLYAQFASANRTTTRLDYTSEILSSEAWLSSTPTAFSDASIRNVYFDGDTANLGDVSCFSLCYSPAAVLTVDSSRYTNLSQIPNLSLGMLVTDDEGSDAGAWFVANYYGTPTTQDVMDYERSSRTRSQELWNRYSQNANMIESMGGLGNYSAQASACGIKYNRTWEKSISRTTTASKYYVSAGYMNEEDGDFIFNVSELRCNVNLVNKAALRTAVQKAIRNGAAIGAKTAKNPTKLAQFDAAFSLASRLLTKINGTLGTGSGGGTGTSFANIDAIAAELDGLVDEILETPDTAEFVVSSACVRAGKQVNVTVSLEENPGIVATSLALDYDSTKLTLVDVRESGLLGDGAFTSGDDLTAVPFITLWANGTTRENITATGTLVTYTFAVSADAPEGETPITVTASNVFDVNFDDVDFTVQNGSVTISRSVPGDVSGDGQVDLKDVVQLTRFLSDGWDSVEIEDLAADVNGDNAVNLKDVTILRRYLAGWNVTLV